MQQDLDTDFGLMHSEFVANGTLTLNPNGTTFTGLWLGARRLAAGRDYTVSGDQLTLTSAR